MLQRTKMLENFAQHCNIVKWRWRHIWRHQKCRLQTTTDILQKLFKSKKSITLQVNCWKN